VETEANECHIGNPSPKSSRGQMPLRTIDDAWASLPQTKGLYAWWAATKILSHLPGPSHPADASIRPLYVGLATKRPPGLVSSLSTVASSCVIIGGVTAPGRTGV
jgi:hypothetical protein